MLEVLRLILKSVFYVLMAPIIFYEWLIGFNGDGALNRFIDWILD